MNKNKRQAYAVKFNAGMNVAAEGWGTGRAVSRIPRVPGGGTNRTGQGAFGNMCRGGRMYNPSRIWRKWHRRVNQNQRRYAVASALAASAVPPLVMARGHKIDQVPEIPLVVGGSISSVQKTKDALKILQNLGIAADVEKAKASKQVRSGKGKSRNRRYTMRKGPLIVFDESEKTLARAFRNLPGVELCHVERLNLLQLAPGNHLGRLIVYTQAAFEKLDAIYGTQEKASEFKQDYKLPNPMMVNTDLSRIINSDEIQSVIKPLNKQVRKTLRKKNPLKNLGVHVKLNPYILQHKRTEINLARNLKDRKEKRKSKQNKTRSTKAERKAYYKKLTADE